MAVPFSAVAEKLNIRPTRSKQELADIVSQTKELIQAKIKQQRDKKDGSEGADRERTGGDNHGNSNEDKRKRMAAKKKAKKQETKAKKKAANAKHKTPGERKEGKIWKQGRQEGCG